MCPRNSEATLQEIVVNGRVTTSRGAAQSQISVVGRDIKVDFAKLAKSARVKPTQLPNGGEKFTSRSGVTYVRYPSKSGPPTIGINPPGGTGPKIRYEAK